MFGLGPAEVTIVLLVALVLFGKNLPTLARSAGRALAELWQWFSAVDNQLP